MATKTMKRGRASRQHQSAPYSSASLSLPMPMHPTGTWVADEHDRFLEAMRLYPKGPWKSIADHVATRSVRQVQTHAQKYQEKVVRRMRGLRKPKRKGDDESDEDIGHRVVLGTYGKLRKRKGGDDESEATPSSVSPTASQSHTDKESVGSDSNDDSDSHSDSSAPTTTRRRKVKISISSPPTPMEQPAKTDAHKPSFSALLEDQSPVGPDSIDLAPLRLSELSPGWLYLDELTDQTLMDAVDENGSALEGPTGLPTLGESLDFFIEHLSIVI